MVRLSMPVRAKRENSSFVMNLLSDLAGDLHDAKGQRVHKFHRMA